MNHKALYRKYRPTEFSQVVGQKDTITILKNSIINKSFAHAYLFSGTKGVGKTSVAKILAKVINCENNIEGEACNQCSNCQIINNSNEEVDILEIDGASNNGVEEIRSIRNNVNLLPMHLKYKIYIIDEVHMLTTSAFNALLKTLEEPPIHIIFILATTEPYKIPETIISRCQWFQFEKITHEELVAVFTQILTTEQIKFEPEALSQLAFLSDGSLRDGINSLEKVFNFANELTLKSVNKLYNITSIEKKISLLLAILKQDINQVILILEELNEYISDFKRFLIELLGLTQDIIIYRFSQNIKVTKFLKLEEINKFNDVSTEDLNLLLNLFENIIILNFNNANLKTLLIARILNLFNNLKKYDLLEKSDSSNLIAEKKDNNQKEITLKQDIVENSNPEVKINNISINDEMMQSVLNVIVQADKDVRKEVKGYWSKIHQLIENNKFRNFSKIYLNTKITAASLNGLIIICDNIIQADLINKNFCYQEHRNFLNFVLTKEYMIYALDKNQWKLVGEKYQELLRDNQLPNPESILIPEIVAQESSETKSKTLAFLQNIFSEIEEI